MQLEQHQKRKPDGLSERTREKPDDNRDVGMTQVSPMENKEWQTDSPIIF